MLKNGRRRLLHGPVAAARLPRGGIDLLTFVIDPFRDQTTAFLFGINPYGVQREGLISNGGATSDDFDLSWDNKWYLAVQRYDDRWTAEIAIPFSTLRYKEGATVWNINSFRQDSYLNERSVWARIPRNFMPFSLAFSGQMQWDQPLGKPGFNASLIPYVAGNVGKDHLEGSGTTSGFSAGGDAKIAVTLSLNLDLTINPDFSQVEVDQQVTNIDRFEIFFPERRGPPRGSFFWRTPICLPALVPNERVRFSRGTLG